MADGLAPHHLSLASHPNYSLPRAQANLDSLIKSRTQDMTEKEKNQKIAVAYNAIETVRQDTDKDLWAFEWLSNALVELGKWYEELDI